MMMGNHCYLSKYLRKHDREGKGRKSSRGNVVALFLEDPSSIPCSIPATNTLVLSV